MKTFSPTPADITHDWYVIDAENQVLGRLAAQIANRLSGKHKPTFAPHVDNGDFIIVVNCDKVKITGTKLRKKVYITHSLYPGSLKYTLLGKMMQDKPTEVITRAVRGMLPRNALGRNMLKKLKVYAGPDHPHAAQNPKPLTLPY